MEFKIIYNPNICFSGRWKYIYILNGQEHEICRASKERLKDIVIYKGLEWNESEIEKLPIKSNDIYLKLMDDDLNETEKHSSISYSRKRKSPYFPRITSWKKSHYKY